MPIKRRYQKTHEYTREEPAVKDRFDLGKDPYETSTAGKMGIPRDKALPVLRLIASQGALLPSGMTTQDLLANVRMCNNENDQVEKRYRDRITSPLTAIRSFCVECKGGSPRQASLCSQMECPVWAFRLGQNAFYGRK
jgi:hypothetical protein